MKKGLCRLCDQTKDLIKAHGIPRSFFKEFKEGYPHAVFFDVSESADREATYVQAGVYDQGILCAECEPKFSEFDRYGWEILGSVSLQNPIQEPGYPPHAHRVFCDTDKLKRFILAVLWRASVSTHSFYSYVSLGPYEDILRARIFDQAPLAIDEFPTSVLHFDQASLGIYEKGILFPPMRERAEDGSNHLVIYLKDLKIVIRVDRRARQRLFDPFLISDPDSFVMAEFPVKVMKRERGFVPAIMRKLKGG
jgi:hypothetical protein